MSVTSAAIAAGRSAAGSSSSGFASGMFGGRRRGGIFGRTQEMVDAAVARRKAAKAGAVGSATSAVGGDNGRLDSIESRITALEGGGGDLAAQGTGGAVKQDLATVTSGTMPEAPLPAGSLSEAMPGPEAASMDIFGSEFARNSAVGAAKMRINKKI